MLLVNQTITEIRQMSKFYRSITYRSGAAVSRCECIEMHFNYCYIAKNSNSISQLTYCRELVNELRNEIAFLISQKKSTK